MSSGNTQSFSEERPMLPPETPKTNVLLSPIRRRCSLMTRSRSAMYRLPSGPWLPAAHACMKGQVNAPLSVSMASSHIFKIMFVNQGKVYEVYARKVSQGRLFGFIEVEDLTFGERSKVLLDPAEERIKAEFEGVKCT